MTLLFLPTLSSLGQQVMLLIIDLSGTLCAKRLKIVTSFFNLNTCDRQDVANVLASILPHNTSASNRPKGGRPKKQLQK